MAYNLVSTLGILALILIAWGLSRNRRRLNWHALVGGLLLQLLVASLIFLLPASAQFFKAINDLALGFIQAATEGQKFLFGKLAYPPGETGPNGDSLGFFFAFQVLPIIVFFAAFMQLLYYFGVMQWLIQGFARLFSRIMAISGAESLCTASNIFVGIESATAVRPYLASMTRSELCLILTAGMATVASSVLAAYVQLLKDVFPNIAGHLISASFISAPAAIVMAKILVPEEGEPETLGRRVKAYYEIDSSPIEAIINGAGAWLRMVANIAALLIAFVGLVAVINWILGGLGSLVGPLLAGEIEWTLENFLGWLFTPLAVVIGVPFADAPLVGKLLAERLVLTEAVAYPHLAEALGNQAFEYPRSALIAAYALCGFAHVASLAIFVGGIAGLAPERRRELASVGPWALLAATLACLLTAAVAGTFFHSGAGTLKLSAITPMTSP